MKRPPQLTVQQRSTLRDLEPKLKQCVKSADFITAKKVAAQIQNLLRPTGHQMRLLQAKNWLYECALEANEFGFAERGFIGTRKLTSKTTRTYLEATALLGVCYVRQGSIEKAKPLIDEALLRVRNIKSDRRRRQFHRRFLSRLEEESVLAGIRSNLPVKVDLDEAKAIAIDLVQRNKSEEEILLELGKALPKKSLYLAEEVRSIFDRRLPGPDRKALPAPLTEETKEELGKRSKGALKRVAWRALCDTDSELYKDWTSGLSAFYDKKVLIGAIAASFVTAGLAPPVVFVGAVVALAMKFGAAVFCDMYEPDGLMIGQDEKE